MTSLAAPCSPNMHDSYDASLPSARMYWEPLSRAALQAPPTVYIFDLDETLIMFNRLLTGQYAAESAQVCDASVYGL